MNRLNIEIMKKLLNISFLVLVGVVLASCALDNYDSPEAHLQGHLVYNGDPIEVSTNDVYFQLWEPGWENSVPINVNVDQDGSFSALLFNANYKLVFPSGQGPFMSNQDTLELVVKGGETVDLDVTPYYMVRNPQISGSGSTVNASCSLEQIITDANARNVERVTLYINKTQFVGPATNIALADLWGGDIVDINDIDLSVGVPTIVPGQDYVFARIGLKIDGVEDMIFSPIQKIDL